MFRILIIEETYIALQQPSHGAGAESGYDGRPVGAGRREAL